MKILKYTTELSKHGSYILNIYQFSWRKLKFILKGHYYSRYPFSVKSFNNALNHCVGDDSYIIFSSKQNVD